MEHYLGQKAERPLDQRIQLAFMKLKTRIMQEVHSLEPNSRLQFVVELDGIILSEYEIVSFRRGIRDIDLFEDVQRVSPVHIRTYATDFEFVLADPIAKVVITTNGSKTEQLA